MESKVFLLVQVRILSQTLLVPKLHLPPVCACLMLSVMVPLLLNGGFPY